MISRIYKICLFFVNFLLYSTFLFSETSFPGINIFSSPVKLSMGGAGFLKASPSSFNLNPSVNKGKIFSASIIRYPASIISQNAGFIFPMKNNGFGSLSINYVSYGTFQGFDEDAQATGSFNSSDTRISAAHSKRLFKLPIMVGISSSIHLSNYNNHDIIFFTLNGGVHLRVDRYGTLMGMSINDLGKNISNIQIDLSPRIIYSVAKELKHLPLTFYMDIIPENKSSYAMYLGGEFAISDNFEFLLGTSTRKFDQNIEKDFFTSIIGSTGMGFGYDAKTTIINYGVFMYGTGSLVHGIEIGISF